MVDYTWPGHRLLGYSSDWKVMLTESFGRPGVPKEDCAVLVCIMAPVSLVEKECPKGKLEVETCPLQAQ